MAHKLLLADDSVTIQRVIELTFADDDIDVTTVGDGQLAIDRLDTDPPDIVLADIDMPKRDGYEVAAYVKSRPRLAHIPVVLLTGAFEPIDQARAAAAGSSDVLAKPFEPQMVINRVKELLGRKRTDEYGSAAPAVAPAEMEPLVSAPPQISSPQPAGRQPSEESAEPVSLDDYFDQLDAAFSNLQPGAQGMEAGSEVDWPALETPPAPVEAPQTLASRPVEKPAPVAPPLPGPPAFVPAPQAIAPTFAADAATAGKPSFAADAVAAGKPIFEADAGTVSMPNFAADAATLDKPTFVPDTATVRTPVEPIASAPVASAPVAPAPVAPAPVAPAPVAPVAHVAPIAPVAPVAPAPVAPVAPVAKTTANPFANLSAAKAEAAARPAAPVISDEVIEEIVSRVLQRMSDRVVRETVTDIVSQTAERLVQDEIERIKTGS